MRNYFHYSYLLQVFPSSRVLAPFKSVVNRISTSIQGILPAAAGQSSLLFTPDNSGDKVNTNTDQQYRKNKPRQNLFKIKYRLQNKRRSNKYQDRTP